MKSQVRYKRVLVTGGAGCIGLQVCHELVSQGFKVHLLDLGEQIARVRSAIPAKVRIFYGSILDHSTIREAMEGCNAVIHLAALLGVKRTEVNRLRCLEVNIDGTKMVLDCAIQYRIKKFIFASSSEVYGEPLQNPIDENAMTQGKSVYAISKLAGEELCKGYAQKYPDFNFVILRFFNAYGPYQPAQFVLPRFILNALRGKPLVINGNGNQVRSYCYASDTARGVVAALQKNSANGHVIDLGNSREPVTINDLAGMVRKIIGNSHLPIKHRRNFKGADRTAHREIRHRYCSGRKAQKLLGFKPTVSLQKGVRAILESASIFEKWESTESPYIIDEMT
ncbi:MAG: hypothetical protein COV74_03150 [Candidatus Omnitrophica bacterium CG11_big_fil_rev_8_21_14_0_20_45_26]|uniref:NAD-dependent epimerase/dehydratase domain-containing protein n=1 Tax=Candidatus Abzuiibacterium crystallinum TaxID=1974748 RepID=A0A2H0LR02_9BACT|nr:MAG: hypothetical protein COV74_03150 [Candidatus Omnitrophica bacterium CG11_big_fil_rev_8_21_14_0_20_45_26]PIW64672.1 MAG: hypothetical protein COW12_05175 [Candidatus Omnitrophica bacterium CG12_big_fil_rev_8_21_14_0_65_45_16]